MTLQGIDRALAKSIINYRGLIGGFRRAEDLALVSGLGASKFASIRDEVCVSAPKRNPRLVFLRKFA
jgi:DNA uptake protein ComE-like DNA-binding protein